VNEVPRRLAVLFLLAVTGVLAAIGAVIARAGGAVAATAYVVVVVLLVGVAAQLAKRRARVAALQRGQTCTCCTGTVHDPVQVI
jgi:hypothetical protein